MAVALLVAAGRGERLGSPGPKAFAMCGGRPMLEWSVEALRAVPEVEHVVVALPPGITAPPGTDGVPGGEQRSQSVLAALRHVRGEDDDAVIVHDAARPLVTPAIVQACLSVLLSEDVAAATDDASLVEAAGGTIRLVPSPRENFKVTTPDDLRLADLLLRRRALMKDR